MSCPLEKSAIESFYKNPDEWINVKNQDFLRWNTTSFSYLLFLLKYLKTNDCTHKYIVPMDNVAREYMNFCEKHNINGSVSGQREELWEKYMNFCEK